MNLKRNLIHGITRISVDCDCGCSSTYDFVRPQEGDAIKCTRCGWEIGGYRKGAMADERPNNVEWRLSFVTPAMYKAFQKDFKKRMDHGQVLKKDVANQPHYTQFKIQPMEFIGVNKLGFLVGNIVKYVCRYNLKNGVEDLKKARHYLDKLIEREEKGTITL